MPDERGNAETMRLFKEKYGDVAKIVSFLMEKAFNWPPKKSEDGKALCAFSMFLLSCHNTMEDVEYMEEMDSPTYMRVII